MAVESIQASGSGVQLMANHKGQNTLFGNAGGIVKGTISGLGDQASVTFGSHKVALPAELLEGKAIGDEMAFMVESNDGKSVVLKAMQDFVGISGNDSVLSSLSQTQIQRNTDQFVNILSSSDLSVDIVSDVEKEKETVANLSSEDLQMLRRLGIDVTGSDLSHLIGLVNQYHAQQEGRSFVTASAEVAMAISQAQNMDKVSDGSLKYMMEQNMTFTYANAYKAEYSSYEMPVKPLEESAWEELKPQVEELFRKQGIAVTEDNLAAGKWMIEHECDLTQANLTLYQQVQQFNQEGLDASVYEENLKKQLEVSEPLLMAPLCGSSLVTKAQELVDDLSTVTNQAVDEVMAEEKPVTIQNLVQAEKQLQEQQKQQGEMISQTEESMKQQKGSSVLSDAERAASNSDSEKRSDTYLKLQEIRIRMTLQSGYQMLRLGIHIEELELSDVIDELNQLEYPQTKLLMQDSRVAVTEENITLYQQTMITTRAITSLPVYTLGSVLSADQAITLSMVYQHGTTMAGDIFHQNPNAEYETIGGFVARYESVMTVPRSDMGDSISKAFDNMDTLLTEMGMQLSADNRKAVKILAYNQMDITQENIARVITLDNNLMSVVQDMKPEVVLGMIRDGINPIKMDLEELRAEINKQKEKNGETSEKKYSEFLYELDKNGDITKEERQSYIGIYRLLNMVTSYQNRDLGALMKSGQEITLDNLLTSYKSRKKTGMDVSVDDEFGLLEQVDGDINTVRQQIENGISYIKEVMNKQSDKETDEELQTQLEEEMKELSRVEKAAIKLTQMADMPFTAVNLMAAQTILENSGSFYQSIRKECEKRDIKSEEMLEMNEQLEHSLLEFLADMDVQDKKETETENIDGTAAVKETDSKTYSPIEEYINRLDSLLQNTDAVTLTAKDLGAMKQVHTMLKMADSLSQRQQYMIPVQFGQEVLTMNVSVIRDSENPGMKLEVETASYGMIQAQVCVEQNGIKLGLYGELASTQQVLMTHQESFMQSLEEHGLQVTDVEIASISDASLVVSTFAEQASTDKIEKVAATTFYQAAKSFIQLIRNL